MLLNIPVKTMEENHWTSVTLYQRLHTTTHDTSVCKPHLHVSGSYAVRMSWKFETTLIPNSILKAACFQQGLSLTIEKKIKDLMRSWIEVVPVLFISSRKNSNFLALETITEEEARDREDDKNFSLPVMRPNGVKVSFCIYSGGKKKQLNP
ncbi:hypothetical protein SADUNF_Sadunf10G0119500 [Salix dunnii]|uniref:Uncharacterized protein n=1 Tax=Salix dunnii TaxID=1413687 RepID=A0A835MPQ1_9ROSI|nr:hypothetical protein SADUNF_Sadunf10G0119500 [Salix dunnii]